MAVCSKCLKRLVFWIILTIISIVVGSLLDLSIIKTNNFPIYIRIIGFTGIDNQAMFGHELQEQRRAPYLEAIIGSCRGLD